MKCHFVRSARGETKRLADTNASSDCHGVIGGQGNWRGEVEQVEGNHCDDDDNSPSLEDTLESKSCIVVPTNCLARLLLRALRIGSSYLEDYKRKRAWLLGWFNYRGRGTYGRE